MSSFYVDSVNTENQYKRLAKNAQYLSQLNLGSSSSWSTKHLLACHVVFDAKRHKSLPILQQDFPDAGKNFGPAKDKLQMKGFINGLAPQHRGKREHFLAHLEEVGTSLAQVWGALQDVCALDEDEDEDEEEGDESDLGPRKSNRVKTQVVHDGFEDSGNIPSSSPSQPGSQQPSSSQIPSSSIETIPYTAEQSSKVHLPHEDYIVQLAFAVIKHILRFTQSPDVETPVELRQKQWATLNVNGKKVTAVDDGGLKLISPNNKVTMNSVVLLEAKRRLLVDPATNQPVLSNGLLGQMLCEALAARSSAKAEDPRGNVFVIHATGHFMCFLHFTISVYQLNQIETGYIPDEALRVAATCWFDLENRSHRKKVVKNVCQMMEYLKARPDEEALY
ncbi:hypothetical protein ACHAQK_009874 [Fusarium lateritium]